MAPSRFAAIFLSFRIINNLPFLRRGGVLMETRQRVSQAPHSLTLWEREAEWDDKKTCVDRGFPKLGSCEKPDDDVMPHRMQSSLQ